MANYNHNCKICGKGYNACDTCVSQRNYAAWRAIACTQDHFQAYMVLYEYGNGTLEKADAKRMLSTVDIEGWENYPEHNKVLIAKILKEDEKPVDDIPEPVQAVEPLTVEPIVVTDEEPLKAEEPAVVELPKKSFPTQSQGYKQPQKPKNNFQKYKK